MDPYIDDPFDPYAPPPPHYPPRDLYESYLPPPGQDYLSPPPPARFLSDDFPPLPPRARRERSV